MNNREAVTLTEEQIAAINKTMANGERVEVIPTKNGARLVKVTRRNIKTDKVGHRAQTTASKGEVPLSAKSGQDCNSL